MSNRLLARYVAGVWRVDVITGFTVRRFSVDAPFGRKEAWGRVRTILERLR